MMPSRIRALLLACAAVAATAVVLQAQVETGKPIQLKAPRPQVQKFKGEVVHASAIQMVVRSRDNEKVVRTFTYSPKVKEQIDRIIGRGGYQAGDRVEIHHEVGSDVAVKIKGRPSRPL